MTVEQLREWNSITDSEVKVGQVLTVALPVAQAPDLGTRRHVRPNVCHGTT